MDGGEIATSLQAAWASRWEASPFRAERKRESEKARKRGVNLCRRIAALSKWKKKGKGNLGSLLIRQLTGPLSFNYLEQAVKCGHVMRWKQKCYMTICRKSSEKTAVAPHLFLSLPLSPLCWLSGRLVTGTGPAFMVGTAHWAWHSVERDRGSDGS